MTDRPAVDRNALRARLAVLAREHPDDVEVHVLAAVRAAGPTGREAARLARELLEELAERHPEVATPDARETWARTLAAVDTFDDPDEEDP